jgi:O-acetyl-ADP-ribose deacetylase (regulator of RNase III)
VIHTVGPVWRGGAQGEADRLAECYRNSLALASEAGLESIAFPSISTGVYGYPIQQASRIAVQEVRAFLASHQQPGRVVFVCFSGADRECYERALEE